MINFFLRRLHLQISQGNLMYSRCYTMTLKPVQPHTSHTVWNKLLSLSAPSLFLPPGAPQLLNLVSRPGLNSRVQSSSPEGLLCPKGKIFFSFESHSNRTRMWLWNRATWFYVLVPPLPKVYPLASLSNLSAPQFFHP